MKVSWDEIVVASDAIVSRATASFIVGFVVFERRVCARLMRLSWLIWKLAESVALYMYSTQVAV